MRRSLGTWVCVLALFAVGCDWEYFFEGDSYTVLAISDFANMGGCPVAWEGASGAKRLTTMIEGLPELKQRLAQADAPPLVFFTAGAVDSVYFPPEEVARLLDLWVSEVLSVRPDAEVVQLNYFGDSPWIDLSSHEAEPRWTVVSFPELEDEGYIAPGLDGIHLTEASYARRAAMLFRRNVRFICSDDLFPFGQKVRERKRRSRH